jgi:hypothetical protein
MSVQVVTALQPIAGADRVVLASVLGWRCVVGLNEFRPGDLAIYVEVDTVLDGDNPAFAQFAPQGHPEKPRRIRTKKLRGVYSQGLLLPLERAAFYGVDVASLAVGTDLTATMKALKYIMPTERFVYRRTANPMLRPFPAEYAPRTDEPRVQNAEGREALVSILEHGDTVHVSQKFDGCSMTVIRAADGAIKVCSRNYEVLRQKDDLYWEVFDRLLAHLGEPDGVRRPCPPAFCSCLPTDLRARAHCAAASRHGTPGRGGRSADQRQSPRAAAQGTEHILRLQRLPYRGRTARVHDARRAGGAVRAPEAADGARGVRGSAGRAAGRAQVEDASGSCRRFRAGGVGPGIPGVRQWASVRARRAGRGDRRQGRHCARPSPLVQGHLSGL